MKTRMKLTRDAMVALLNELGTDSDAKIAAKYNVKVYNVRSLRKAHDIPAHAPKGSTDKTDAILERIGVEKVMAWLDSKGRVTSPE